MSYILAVQGTTRQQRSPSCTAHDSHSRCCICMSRPHNVHVAATCHAQANTVHRTARARKERLTESCASRYAAIRQELEAELAAIVAGVQAGQPLLSEPVAAAMRRSNSTLEAAAASCAASMDAADEEIKRVMRVMHRLANQRELLGLGTTAAAEGGA